MLGRGMPQIAGIGFGIDRMAMIVTDANDIRDTQLFPYG